MDTAGVMISRDPNIDKVLTNVDIIVTDSQANIKGLEVNNLITIY